MARSLRTLPFLLSALALVALTPALVAQQTASVTGTVVDQDGAPIRGVSATLSAEGADFSVTQQTNKKGRFTITVIDASRSYILTLSADGYQTLKESLKLRSGQSLKLSWTMVPGSPAGEEFEPDKMEGGGPAVKAFNAGVKQFNSGNPEGALSKFEEAASLDPELKEAHEVLGSLYFTKDEFDKALASALRTLELDPASAQALRVRYDALVELGRRDEALAGLEELIAADPSKDTARRVFNVGAAYARENKSDEAIAYFERVLTIDPELSRAHSILGSLKLNQGRNEEALTHAETLLATEPQAPRGLQVRYLALRRLGRTEEADAALTEFRSVAPEILVESFLNEGVHLFEAGEVGRAIDALKLAVEVEPDNAEVNYRLGLAYLSAEQPALAKTHLAKFIELAPDNPEVAAAQEMMKYLD